MNSALKTLSPSLSAEHLSPQDYYIYIFPAISKKNQDHVSEVSYSLKTLPIRQLRRARTVSRRWLMNSSRPSNYPSFLSSITVSLPTSSKPQLVVEKRQIFTEQSDSFIWNFKSGVEMRSIFNDQRTIFTFFPSLTFMILNWKIVWMPSFVKKISIQCQTIESYLITSFAFNAIVLEQFLILMTSLYLSYQFNNYSIYASIIILISTMCSGHSSDMSFENMFLAVSKATNLFTLYNLKNEFQLNFMVYSLFTLLVYYFKSCSIIYDSS